MRCDGASRAGRKSCAAVMAGKGADGDRREGRAEGGGADRAEIAAGDRGEHRRAVEIAGLALVGRHAERGVALEMLGDAEALARRELHVGYRHVVLEIDERLAPAVLDQPHRACRPASVSALAAGPLEAVKPQSVAAVAPAAWPSARHAPRPNEPAAAPATLMPGGNAPGTSAASASLHCGLPLRWVVRWRLGFQPPDTATRSHAKRSVLPPASLTSTPGDGLASAHAVDRTAWRDSAPLPARQRPWRAASRPSWRRSPRRPRRRRRRGRSRCGRHRHCRRRSPRACPAPRHSG